MVTDAIPFVPNVFFMRRDISIQLSYAWRIRQNFVKISKKIRYGTRLIMEQDFFVGSSGKQQVGGVLKNNGLSKFGEGKRDREKTRQENKFQNYYQYHKFILIHKF